MDREMNPSEAESIEQSGAEQLEEQPQGETFSERLGTEESEGQAGGQSERRITDEDLGVM